MSNKVLSGDLSEKRANCIIYACNSSLAAIKARGPEVDNDMFELAKEILGGVPSVIDQ